MVALIKIVVELLADVARFAILQFRPPRSVQAENLFLRRQRRFIPRKTDLATLSDERFQTLVAAYNNTPRKCLDWMTPAETFSQVLHFECESTSPRPRGRADRMSYTPLG